MMEEGRGIQEYEGETARLQTTQGFVGLVKKFGFCSKSDQKFQEWSEKI